MRSMDEQKQAATFGRHDEPGPVWRVDRPRGGRLPGRAVPGERRVAPEPGPGAAVFGDVGTKKHVDVLLHVLLALAVVIIAARALGALFARLRQPPVIGEVVAGILLGPSLLGRVAPERLGVPAAADGGAAACGVIAQVGVILYMFLVGLELNPALLRSTRRTPTVAISHASIVVPFLLGAALALWLYPRLSTPRRAVHQLRAVHGRGDVDHRLPGAGAHPHRPGHARGPRWASSR